MTTKNQKIHVDETVIRILYYKYKQYIIPTLFFVGAIAIFFYITIPQIQNFFAVQQEADVNRQTIAVLTQNSNILSNVSTAKLHDLITIANEAVPKDKNFEVVLD